MKKVLLRAPLLTSSGYGVHSRQIFEWLFQKKDIDLTVECLRWGMTSWMLDQNNEIVKNIMSCSKKIEPKYDISFQVQLPNEWDPSLAKVNYGITAAVETTKCAPEWINHCNKMDAIIVPSNFTKNVIKKSGIVTKKIFVIPEYYNHDILKKENDLNLNLKTKFNFLAISQLTGQTIETDRKNIINCIKWFCETFEGNQEVGLVIKTSMCKGTKIDRKLTVNYMTDLIRHVRKTNFPKIVLLHGNMKQKEIASLYKDNNIKCFISPTRGEGYGLPLVDAAASGMPVIATNWSGHLDFLPDNFLKVDYDLIDIHESKIDNKIFFKGMKWADPKEESFKKCLLEVYNDYGTHKTHAENYSIDLQKKITQRKHIFNV